MEDQNKTKRKHMDKFTELRQRVAELEAFEDDHTRVDEQLHKWGK